MVKVTEDTVAILRAMADAEDRGEPAAKAAHQVRKDRRLNPTGFNGLIRYLWSNRLITCAGVPQRGGTPDTLVPEGVTDEGRSYLTA